MRYLFTLILCLLLTFMKGQELESIRFDSTLSNYTNRLSSDTLHKFLSVISADSLEGRETGEHGQKIAANYIADQMRDLGITGVGDSLDYFQRFGLWSIPYDQSYMVVDGDTLNALEDYYTFSPILKKAISGDRMIFLGYGIEDSLYNNYQDIDASGKIGVIMSGEPSVGKTYTLTNSEEQSKWSSEFDLKRDAAIRNGCKGLIVVSENFEQLLPRVSYYLKRKKLKLEKPDTTYFPVSYVGSDFIDAYFGEKNAKKMEKKLQKWDWQSGIEVDKSVDWYFEGDYSYVHSENVMGKIEGSSKPKEAVVITAHYDHLGKTDKVIYNGADDDGSGTSALLEVMRVFKEAENEGNGPKRTVLFLFVSGEEKGLLGSSYYTDNPLFPLNATVANLNIDMIGRTDVNHEADSSKYIYLIGSDKISTELHLISEKMNELYTGFEIDYKYNDEDDPTRLYYRSDHYNFAKNGIPVIFYFRGLHEDYHKPEDTIEKIEFDTIREVSKLVFTTAWQVLNKEDRLNTDVN
ncbi:MAG: M28 family peptidase [Cryomorphaceae bacterium]|nr:M28 family peptidase [Flavobacteriales bacterium]